MNKKGFTLIELLAVIVILAIIALIATPIVLNIIDDAKKESDLRSAEFYLKSLELSIAQAVLDDNNITDGVYNILENGNICLSGETTIASCTNPLTVEVKGKVPASGTISITNGQIGDVLLKLDNNEIVKDEKGELAYKSEKSEDKEKTLEEVCTYKSGTEKTAGAKYECKVDPNKDQYTFYILSYLDESGNIVTNKDNAVSVNLIMDSNIRTGGEPVKEEKPIGEQKALMPWISGEKYYEENGGEIPEDVLNDGGVCEYDGYCVYNDKGPLTAMDYLEEATKNWTNTNKIIISEFTDEEGGKHPIAKIYNMYSRLPYYSEVEDVSTDKIWLIDYLDGTNDEDSNIEGRTSVNNVWGYWLLSACTWDVSYSFAVDSSAFLYDTGVLDSGYIGVRPVINLII